MNHRICFAAMALGLALSAPVQATDIALPADGQWRQFSVDALLSQSFDTRWIDDSDGSPLTFSFAIPAGSTGALTVVDGVFAGDTFVVDNFGVLLGPTSPVPMGYYDTATNVGFDFDAALADADFSRAVFTLSQGSYRIGGRLAQSVSFDGAPLDATAGALRLSVSAVPEPASVALLLAGLCIVACAASRRHKTPQHTDSGEFA